MSPADRLNCALAPCQSCPYRKDAPRQLWQREEFELLLANDAHAHGPLYLCHKNNGTMCTGWVMDQDRRHLPNIALRLEFMLNRVTVADLDLLRSPAALFPNVNAMCQANYPDLV